MTTATITLIGGPTALLLTDPTFDDPGEYALSYVTLKKSGNPALRPDQIGAIDAVLLSHDQHSDNLDTLGRAFLQKANRVFTTEAGADRLGGNAQGLRPWATAEISNGNGGALDIAATPARHGPIGIEPLSGDVIGFVVSSKTHAFNPLYISGDTVWPKSSGGSNPVLFFSSPERRKRGASSISP